LPDQLDVGPRCIKLAPPVVAALDRFLAWRAESYTGPSRYLLISAAGRVRDQPISKQTLSRSTFLGTSPAGLRRTAIRCLVQLGVDGLELAAQTRLQLAAVQEYQRAFDRKTDLEPFVATAEQSGIASDNQEGTATSAIFDRLLGVTGNGTWASLAVRSAIRVWER
jgi:hypothetical protein